MKITWQLYKLWGPNGQCKPGSAAPARGNLVPLPLLHENMLHVKLLTGSEYAHHTYDPTHVM
jgi:hypothetical protein